MSLDPLSSKYPSWSAYNYVLSNPVFFIDPDGKQVETDYINKKTGEVVHHEDGKDEIKILDDKYFPLLEQYMDPNYNGWKPKELLFVDIVSHSELVKNDSDLGKIIRTVFAEMSSFELTNDIDRQVVAESIVNRKKSGKFGKTYSDILIPSQYNAVSKDVYKDGPYEYLKNVKKNSPDYYETNKVKIESTLLNAISVSYKAYKGIGEQISNGALYYVSPPLSSSHFDKGHINLTESIIGLKGISGVWK